MHIGKMLARLNPTTVRYDIGRGGIPELTAQDIAAAVAMVPAGLGRELLCRLWWPDGARLTAGELDRLLMDAQMAEWRERADDLLNAQLQEAYAKNTLQRARAQSAISAAKARMWPRIGPQSCYASIRVAVLAEMSTTCCCPVCGGRTERLVDSKLVTCAPCDGSGRQKVSERARAAMIDRDVSTYRESWADVYKWTLDLCNVALLPAQDQLRTAAA